MNIKPSFHGSDLEKVAEYYHIPRDKIVCYSANVNPLGLSEHLKDLLCQNLDILSSYPDREYRSLRMHAARYCNTSDEYIVPGNGTTELISLAISVLGPKHALLLGPSYSEYTRELTLAGCSYKSYYQKKGQDFRLDMDDFLKTLSEHPEVDFIILCNPNNPTSSALTVDEIRILLKTCQKHNVFVMIDETYCEFSPKNISAVPLVVSFKNLLVLRGLSKFFAAPGLRLGYGVTSSPYLLRQMREVQNPWSVNSAAAFAGEVLFDDTSYIGNVRSLIEEERSRMMRELSSWKNIRLYPAYANFILIEITKPHTTSYDVFEYLIQNHLMVRDCSSFPGLDGEFIRFCIMLPKENDRLLQHLKTFLET